jgi:hypothetical protein
VGALRGTKILSRIRAGGVVVSRAKLAKDVASDPSASITSHKKMRVAGLPNRKASSLKKGR